MLERLRRLFRPTPPPVAPAPAPEPEPSAIDQYVALCRQCGIDRLYLLLTFDCDTDFDIAVVADLARDLKRRGIASGYAVPGSQLQKGGDVWASVAREGAEFLNHGGRAHAEFRDDRYWPITFYEQLPADAVVADIELGDRITREVTGTAPEGFRAPHFGSFQSPEQLDLIYSTVRRLGYTYCSTTTPATALSHGPVVSGGHGIIELPTMGSYRNPTTLLDSWTYLTNRVHYTLGDEYYELFAETIERMQALRLPGLLTYYADPSHVAGQRPFERVLDVLAQHHVPSLHGRDAVRRFRAL